MKEENEEAATAEDAKADTEEEKADTAKDSHRNQLK
jgi:hypothetical protein